MPIPLSTAPWANSSMILMLALGFSSGLPLALTSGTLQAWLTTAGADLTTIGLFTLVGLPYTLKFLWAPLMDRYVLPWLGRRRGWMLVTQILLGVGILALAGADPVNAPMTVAILALIVAFASASQDVAIDAYRVELLAPTERGLGAAVSVVGYRVAMLLTGAGALVAAQFVGFSNVYFLTTGFLVVGLIATIFGQEPTRKDIEYALPPPTLRAAIEEPLREFFLRPGALILLALIILYKFGDAFADSLTTAFLIRGVGFDVGEVGAINKGLGLASLLLGGLIGGAWLARLGLYRALLFFGVLQAVSNLTFAILAWAGKSYLLMIAAVGFEKLAGGMGTAAFVALLMGLCDPRYTATQFALLSALAALGRVYVGPAAGFVVDAVGWAEFFIITSITALPGLILLVKLRERLLPDSAVLINSH
ncbi:muropeptide:H(+) symporter [Gammaproteobacteria bacterium]